ncbi:MAG: hypothetical protein QW212_01080 [Nitrososphaerales archaeon]
MRLERNSKNIKNGELYIKHSSYFVVGRPEERGVLSTLSSLLREGEDYYLVLSGERAYFFDFKKGKIEVLDREEGRAVLYEYPYAITGEEGKVPPGKPQVKGVLIDRKKALLTLFLSVGFLGFLIGNKLYKNYQEKKRMEMVRRLEEERKRAAMQKPVVELPPCTANVRSFLTSYIFPASVEGATVVLQGEDSAIRVPLRQEKESRTGPYLKVYSPSYDISYRQTAEGLVFEMKNMAWCLDFVYRNAHLPLTVVSLDTNGCKINITGGCLYEKN